MESLDKIVFNPDCFMGTSFLPLTEAFGTLSDGFHPLYRFAVGGRCRSR
jgi:hypothetical protein